MKGNVIPLTIIGMLFALVLLGSVGIAWVSGPELTPAQRQLIELAD